MRVNENEVHVMFDVDDTLVMWGMPKHKDAISIVCPYTGETLRLVPHKTHINVLKHQKARGFYITVWSAGGWKWAKTVVEALGLTDHVDEVRSKPMKFFDDLPAQEVLGTRVYIDFKDDTPDALKYDPDDGERSGES